MTCNIDLLFAPQKPYGQQCMAALENHLLRATILR